MPVVFGAAGKHHLQNDRAGLGVLGDDVERRRRAHAPRHGNGEAGGVEDDIGRRANQQFLQHRRRHFVLEAGDEHRKRVQAGLA